MKVEIKYHTQKGKNFAEETYSLEVSGDYEMVFKRVAEFDTKHSKAETKFGKKV